MSASTVVPGGYVPTGKQNGGGAAAPLRSRIPWPAGQLGSATTVTETVIAVEGVCARKPRFDASTPESQKVMTFRPSVPTLRVVVVPAYVNDTFESGRFCQVLNPARTAGWSVAAGAFALT